MPFGKNSHLTVLRHFPRWHQLACTSLTESAQVFALFCCSYLLPGWLINALCLLPQLSVINAASTSPIHPETFTARSASLPDHTLRVLPAAPPLTRIKYGASWDKRRTPAKDFRDYSLVLFPWRASCRFLIDRFLRWCRKRIVWAAKRRVWRFLYRF